MGQLFHLTSRGFTAIPPAWQSRRHVLNVVFEVPWIPVAHPLFIFLLYHYLPGTLFYSYMVGPPSLSRKVLT